MARFQVGDMVRVSESTKEVKIGSNWPRGEKGKVVYAEPGYDTIQYIVEFAGAIEGHSGHLADGAKNRWWLNDEDLEPAGFEVGDFVVVSQNHHKEWLAGRIGVVDKVTEWNILVRIPGETKHGHGGSGMGDGGVGKWYVTRDYVVPLMPRVVSAGNPEADALAVKKVSATEAVIDIVREFVTSDIEDILTLAGEELGVDIS